MSDAKNSMIDTARLTYIASSAPPPNELWITHGLTRSLIRSE